VRDEVRARGNRDNVKIRGNKVSIESNKDNIERMKNSEVNIHQLKKISPDSQVREAETCYHLIWTVDRFIIWLCYGGMVFIPGHNGSWNFHAPEVSTVTSSKIIIWFVHDLLFILQLIWLNVSKKSLEKVF
jgi:hypothetical protein